MKTWGKNLAGLLMLSSITAVMCCTLLLALPKKTNVAASTSVESEYLVNNGIYDDEYTGTVVA